MTPPLDFLRNWLPSARSSDEGAEASALRSWLDSMNGAAPEDVASSLAQRMHSMVSGQSNLHMRIKLLDTFEEVANELLPPLEREVADAPLPFTAALQAKALAADNLLKALSSNYAAVLGTIESRHLGGGLALLAQHAAQKATRILRRRLLLAYRAYATPSPSSWQQLHDLYRTSVRLDVTGAARSGMPIEQIYISALLLAYADPGKFARTELEVLQDFAERAANLVHLRRPEAIRDLHAGAPLFAVAPEEAGPGKPLVRTRSAGTANYLYLDCTNLAATIRSDIGAKSRLDMPHAWLLPNASLAMLRTLAAMWGAQPTRRFSRMRFKPRADLVIGLLDVSLFLSGGAFRRRSNDSEKRGISSPAVSEWALVDESPDGFGIRYVRGDIGNVEVGDIVGIRPRESSHVQICLVRRVSNAGQTRFELGLQNLSPHALVVDLPASADTARAKAVLLPRMPAYNNAAGLLSTPGRIPDGLEILYPTGGTKVRLKLAQRIEGNSRNDFYLLLPS
jgi:hypothetical protein